MRERRSRHRATRNARTKVRPAASDNLQVALHPQMVQNAAHPAKTTTTAQMLRLRSMPSRCGLRPPQCLWLGKANDPSSNDWSQDNHGAGRRDNTFMTMDVSASLSATRCVRLRTTPMRARATSGRSPPHVSGTPRCEACGARLRSDDKDLRRSMTNARRSRPRTKHVAPEQPAAAPSRIVPPTPSPARTT